jgi:hypothetical protein
LPGYVGLAPDVEKTPDQEPVQNQDIRSRGVGTIQRSFDI